MLCTLLCQYGSKPGITLFVRLPAIYDGNFEPKFLKLVVQLENLLLFLGERQV